MSLENNAKLQYLRRIESRQPLRDEAREAFLALDGQVEEYGIYADIVREDEKTTHCCLLASGCASRYKTLDDGERQIMSFHFPGEMVDLQSALLLRSDHGIRTHTAVTAVRIPSGDILRLAEDFPEWNRAFWFDTLKEAAIFREWMANVGRRSAVSRVAHLLLEFAHRMKEAGESDGIKFLLPVTQNDLADAAGLSAVHTNRSLQNLREEGLIRTYGRTVVIEKKAVLAKKAGFSDDYLTLPGPRSLENGSKAA